MSKHTREFTVEITVSKEVGFPRCVVRQFKVDAGNVDINQKVEEMIDSLIKTF